MAGAGAEEEREAARAARSTAAAAAEAARRHRVPPPGGISGEEETEEEDGASATLSGSRSASVAPEDSARPARRAKQANSLASSVVVLDDGEQERVTVQVRGKEKELMRKALCFLSVDNCVRQLALLLVEWKWFDRLILLCIVVNSVLLGIYQHRAQRGIDDHYALNEFIDNTADHFFWAVFSVESFLKIIAWGFILGKKSYLRDPWNVLDFTVVVSGLIERLGLGAALDFLRLFRLLRPLRSLNAVPQMKVLVNTALSSILKLGNVVVLGTFLFMVFGIVGLSLMTGIFYRQCYSTPNPVLLPGQNCWSWNVTGEERLCGGNFACPAGSFCGGHEQDHDALIRPSFPGGKRDLPWCEGSAPHKLFPETDFVHFDHIGAASLLVFQSMTLEGWTDIMYMVEDAFSPWFAVIFFSLIVILTNFFMLNVALAVVDEVQDELVQQSKAQEEERRRLEELEELQPTKLETLVEGEEEAESPGRSKLEPAGGELCVPPPLVANDDLDDLPPEATDTSLEEPPAAEGAEGADGGKGLWLDCCLVRCCDRLAKSEAFMNFILFIIACNVINMCMQWFSLTNTNFGHLALDNVIKVLEITFLAIFISEMFVMLIALGPKGYVKNPITAFDGFVVIISVIELVINETGDGSGGGLSALRTFRLFRVMNKLANKWSKLKVLLKAMLHTGGALNYWLVLFGLVLYIFTLMWMSVFAKQFHFEDADALYPLVPRQYADQEWCPETDDGRSWHHRQDCIPRAHFDTFTWGFVTVFQVMTGENWNTIMYAGLRASERWEGTVIPPTMLSAGLFVLMILFGQTLFLSLFLSMLISTFDEVQDQFEEEEREKNRGSTRKSARPSQAAIQHVSVFISRIRSISSEVGAVQVGEAGPDEQDRKQRFQRFVDEDDDEPSPPEGAGSLPGQMPSSEGACLHPALKARERALAEAKAAVAFKEADELEKEIPTVPTAAARRWPHGHALLLLSPSNRIRKGAQWLLTMKVQVGGTQLQVFDNFILACILLSTLCMMADTPLSDPRQLSTRLLRGADQTFAFIFMAEMAVKLVAMGLICGPGTYLRSGWNCLDFIVVMVSVVDLVSGGEGPGFLRVLRILRTFRPLRVISRNEGLRVVVQTIFQSMGDLFGLVIVSSLFLLIFALIFLMYLKGALYQCNSEGDLRLLRGEMAGIGDNFVTPMCLSLDARGVPSQEVLGGVADGDWSPSNSSCGAGAVRWQRPTADTPICMARCDPLRPSHPGLEHLCSRRYTVTEELPSMCADAGDPNRMPQFSTREQEAVGKRYVADMQRTLTLPCGGLEHGDMGDARNMSCSGSFCKGHGPATESCVAECKSHPFFCVASCKAGLDTEDCRACRSECEAACMCQDFCTPLVLDAALCHEQGGSWEPVLSQNFNNIANSMLTLFEISTTEGWVDVMYAASDFTDVYRQPVRDNNHGPYVFLFPFWILLSFMFLINLAVGVIVDNFENAMDDREQKRQVLLTESQKRWLKSRKSLHARAYIFDLTDLHLLPPLRRKLYDFISGKLFENVIMTAIVINTLIMALTVFPAPVEWWPTFQEYANYAFAAIFTVEAVLKLAALRGSYWLDAWNRFDFVCVVATLVGIVLKLPAIDLDIGAATSVIRIMRIARLFRLLRFLRELNRLFMCLLISIPKLYNVMMILCLFLVLFSILGMSLFGTAKFPTSDGTLNEHGNFQTFWRGFVTLFRASTGEAWNEIMHNLAKHEKDYFREGDWCTPQQFYRTRDADTFAVLEEKCLISSPNACPGSWNPMPAVYWVSYTLLITFMIMNLVVAVILKGYEEGKEDAESDNIELCIEVWKRHDPDHKMSLPLPTAMRFLHEVMRLSNAAAAVDLPVIQGKEINEIAKNVDMRSLSKFGKLAVEMNVVEDENGCQGLTGEVSFLSASRQALRLLSMNGVTNEDVEEIAALDDRRWSLRRSQVLFAGRFPGQQESDARVKPNDTSNFIAHVAAWKIQEKFRQRRQLAAEASAEQTRPEEQPEAGNSAAALPSCSIRCAAQGDAAPEVDADVFGARLLVPPRAG